ncbi:MAG: mannose-1-phosphate guanylyltransferase [Kiritimatiellia bacterium]|nr:NTP transferase domain-containing protein [Lentisphaerota bacterium]
MSDNSYAVVLAGGRGERFWPKSTEQCPKQLLPLAGKQPLLVEAVARLQPLIPQERVLILTNAALIPAIRQAMPDFPTGNIIGEPCGRDTAPAVATAVAIIKARCPTASLVVLTADHVIGDLPVFQQTLADSLQLAASEDTLVTIGIRPLTPSTGFGYLEAGDELSHKGATKFHRVRRFVEKPDMPTAEQYLAAGNYYWNSGMFAWSVATFESAAGRHHPELTTIIEQLSPLADKPMFEERLAEVYDKTQKISVDYAIMEKSRNIAMAQALFRWDDVGTWSALAKHFPADADGNVTIGRAALLDSGNNIIDAGDNLIALIGVNDLVVVQHNNATLICPKNRDQDVKKIVEQLRQRPDCRGWL